MAKIILAYRIDYDKRGKQLPSYAESMDEAFQEFGHEVTRIGKRQPGYQHISEMPETELKRHDLLVDIDCGRDEFGKLHFQYQDSKCPIPNAARFVDTHGFFAWHRKIARNYQHVFFAVWSKRDCFSKCPSVHWAPCASDEKWFDYQHFNQDPKIDVGFFSTKLGLKRAWDLLDICKKQRYTYDIREVGRYNRQRWPSTGEAMANCRVLFNKGQKHDSPNQRVIESMLANRPLISDRDPLDGMDKLFEEGTHYLAYESKAELALQLERCFDNYDLAKEMSQRAYDLVKKNHLIKHRVQDIIEVCL